MSGPYRIRLIGQSHATYHDGAVLTLTDNEGLARTNDGLVTIANALELIARGEAEWVREPEQRDPLPRKAKDETFALTPAQAHIRTTHKRQRAEMMKRQAEEQDSLVERHADEHAQMLERHNQEVKDLRARQEKQVWEHYEKDEAGEEPVTSPPGAVGEPHLSILPSNWEEHVHSANVEGEKAESPFLPKEPGDI